MKNLFIYIIRIYQAIPGPWHGKCRFYPTCSNYAIEAIERFGFIKGSVLSFKRIIRCRPFGGFGYDPVTKEVKK
ncbi:MAG: membrane protein insertion efficiency factor YidD [Bacilli bacterium]|nr:membrane protein insertion efficiency factor YidD [Bacilli bacterium]